MGPSALVSFANGQKSWTEEEHLVRSLAAVLRELGHEPRDRGDWLELGDGFTLLPQVVQVQPFEPSGVGTVSTIQVAHPKLMPAGVFEYQHAGGDDLRDSFAKGFRMWAQVDLPVFLELGADKPATTMMMDFDVGQAKAELPCDRRVVLGPTQHFARSPLADDVKDEHPFCPCCLFTNSLDAFRRLLAQDAFFGIRLYAMRDTDGTLRADCRVNGVDYPAGVEALIRYAGRWPDRGFEFRKQYAAIRSKSPR